MTRDVCSVITKSMRISVGLRGSYLVLEKQEILMASRLGVAFSHRTQPPVATPNYRERMNLVATALS